MDRSKPAAEPGSSQESNRAKCHDIQPQIVIVVNDQDRRFKSEETSRDFCIVIMASRCDQALHLEVPETRPKTTMHISIDLAYFRSYPIHRQGVGYTSDSTLTLATDFSSTTRQKLARPPNRQVSCPILTRPRVLPSFPRRKAVLLTIHPQKVPQPPSQASDQSRAIISKTDILSVRDFHSCADESWQVFLKRQVSCLVGAMMGIAQQLKFEASNRLVGCNQIEGGTTSPNETGLLPFR